MRKSEKLRRLALGAELLPQIGQRVLVTRGPNAGQTGELYDVGDDGFSTVILGASFFAMVDNRHIANAAKPSAAGRIVARDADGAHIVSEPVTNPRSRYGRRFYRIIHTDGRMERITRELAVYAMFSGDVETVIVRPRAGKVANA